VRVEDPKLQINSLDMTKSEIYCLLVESFSLCEHVEIAASV
jgi:hypothetical protein